jgi:hypothetical protein
MQYVCLTLHILLNVLFSVSLTTSSSTCQVLQDTALSALLGSVPSHVATFGNSDVNKVGDWVKILNNKPTQKVDKNDANYIQNKIYFELRICFCEW